MGYKFNPFTSELDVVDSQWEQNTYGGADYLQPKNTDYGIAVGAELHSSITSAFNGIAAIFNSSLLGDVGLNYFANFSYGDGFLALGSLFLGGRANGTSSAPTEVFQNDMLGGVAFSIFDGSQWNFTQDDHSISGLWYQASQDASVQSSQNIWLGGLTTPMIKLETDTNAIKFNEAQLDSDITFYNETGTTLVLDGGTGNVTAGNLSATTANSLANIDTAQTFTNKRITTRVDTTTSSATPTINTDNVDMYGLTAQTADITSFTTNLSGTPTNGQKLWIYIVGTAARAITWGASFENGPSTLPTTTVGTERLDVSFVWNAVSSKWRCVAAGSS